MKSFKLISLQVVTSEEELIDVELTEGLVINKEDEHNRWILEGFIHKDYYENLQKAITNQSTVRLQGVITKKENNPATFDTEILTFKQIDDYYSVLFEGHIVSSQNEYAEMLLKKLLSEGLEGDLLVRAFRENIQTRPRITSNPTKS